MSVYARFIIALLAFVLFAANPAPRAETLSIVTLHYADAQEVVRSLNGILEADASIRAYQNQLVINAKPSHLEELKSIIMRLDKAPQNLLISVRQPNQTTRQQAQFNVSGVNGSNYQQQFSSGSSDSKTRTQTRIISRASRTGAHNNVSQSVRVLEGHDAFIRTGSQIRYSNNRYDRFGRPLQSAPAQDIKQGFWANIRTSGQQVVVSIRTVQDRLQPSGHSVQDINTQITGRLGQWITLGQVFKEDKQTHTELLGRSTAADSRSSSVAIKVERVN